MILDSKETCPSLQRGDIFSCCKTVRRTTTTERAVHNGSPQCRAFLFIRCEETQEIYGKLSLSQHLLAMYVPAQWLYVNETPDSVGGHKEDLVLLVDHKGSKTSPDTRHYVTFAFLYPWVLQRPMSSVIKSGLWHSKNTRNRNETSSLPNISFLPHHTAPIWEEILYLINGSNYQFLIPGSFPKETLWTPKR